MKRRLASALLAAAFGLVLALGFAASAQAEIDVAGWQFKDLTANDISVPITFDLAFDSERVAWVELVNGQPDVYLADIDTGAETQISDSAAWEHAVALDGDHLAWVEHSSNDWLGDSTVWLKDLAGGQPARALLTAPIALDARLMLVGDYLAWVQYDPYPGGPSGVRAALYVQRLSTGAVTRISDAVVTGVGSNEGEKAFDLTTTHLAFVESVPDEDARVTLYDLATSERQELGRTTRATEHVDLEGDLLTWSQADETAPYEHAVTRIFIHRLSRRNHPRTSAPIFRTYPKTDGRFVIWEQEQRPAVQPLPFPLREIWAYDADTERLSDVSQNEFLNFTPEISAGLVVWERGGELDSEIMAHDLLTGETTQLSSNRTWMDQLALVSDRTVVWWKHWFSMETGVAEPADRFMVATAPASFVSPFADVPGQHRFRTAILAMDELEIAGGYPLPGITGGHVSDGKNRVFRPEATLLRAQFAKMICEAFDLPVSEGLRSAFTDLGADDPANLYPHEYVAALTASGVIKGKTATRFDPYAPVTRAQAVTLLVRALDAFEPGLLKNISGQAPGAYYWEPPHLDNLRRAYANDLLSSTIDWLQRWDARVACSRGEAAQMLWNALELMD